MNSADWPMQVQALQGEVSELRATLEAEVARLRAALDAYSRHAAQCMCRSPSQPRNECTCCTCGLAAALLGGEGERDG